MTQKPTRRGGYFRTLHCGRFSTSAFRKLSDPAQLLYFKLRVVNFGINIPGLVSAGMGLIGDKTGRGEDYLIPALQELADAAFLVHDLESQVIYLPGVITEGPPDNGRHMAGWGRSLAEIPECDPFRRWRAELASVVRDLGCQDRNAALASLFPESVKSSPPASDPATNGTGDGIGYRMPDGIGEGMPDGIDDGTGYKQQHRQEQEQQQQQQQRADPGGGGGPDLTLPEPGGGPGKPTGGEDDFRRFLDVYPKAPNDEAEARREWDAAQKAGDLPKIASLLKTVRFQVQGPDWTKENGRYVPLPENYIRKRAWRRAKPMRPRDAGAQRQPKADEPANRASSSTWRRFKDKAGAPPHLTDGIGEGGDHAAQP